MARVLLSLLRMAILIADLTGSRPARLGIRRASLKLRQASGF